MKIVDAYNLARTKLEQYGLGHWKVEFIRSCNTLGRCWNGKEVIELAVQYVELNNEREVLDTILHEIAHALVGHHHAHDYIWASKCAEIGGVPLRVRHNVKVVKDPYHRYKCVNCGHVYILKRKLRNLEYKFHRECGELGRLTAF